MRPSQILALVVAVAVVAPRPAGSGCPRRWSSWSSAHRVAGPGRARVPRRPRRRADRLPAAAALRRRAAHLAGRRAGQPAGDRHPGGRRGRVHDAGRSAWWPGRSIPGVSLAAAFALGAVVSPPDAVAATTIARRVGMPRRIVSILEGESLLNDATALVALRTTTAAIAASVTVLEVGVDFVLAAGGGVRRRAGRGRGAGGGPQAGRRTRCSTRPCRWSRRSSPTWPPRPCTRAGCSPWSSSACCSGTSRRPCSRRRPGSPSRPTGAPSRSSWRTPSSC